jgi:acyl carrier protein
MDSARVSRNEILKMLYESIDDVNQQLLPEQRIVKSLDTPLLGGTSPLDSLAYVNLIALIEEKCEERFGVSISLSDAEEADSFDDLGSLLSFLEQRVKF